MRIAFPLQPFLGMLTPPIIAPFSAIVFLLSSSTRGCQDTLAINLSSSYPLPFCVSQKFCICARTILYYPQLVALFPKVFGCSFFCCSSIFRSSIFLFPISPMSFLCCQMLLICSKMHPK